MAAKVVDASAIGALVFAEPDAESMAERLQGADLFAPPLLPFELASICLKKMRLHPAQRDALLEAFSLAARLPITLVEVAHAEVVPLAERTALSTYDASYLWLTPRYGEIVTLDKRLAATARKFAAAER